MAQLLVESPALLSSSVSSSLACVIGKEPTAQSCCKKKLTKKSNIFIDLPYDLQLAVILHLCPAETYVLTQCSIYCKALCRDDKYWEYVTACALVRSSYFFYYEPSPMALAELTRNTELQGMSATSVIQHFVSSKRLTREPVCFKRFLRSKTCMYAGLMAMIKADLRQCNIDIFTQCWNCSSQLDDIYLEARHNSGYVDFQRMEALARTTRDYCYATPISAYYVYGPKCESALFQCDGVWHMAPNTMPVVCMQNNRSAWDDFLRQTLKKSIAINGRPLVRPRWVSYSVLGTEYKVRVLF